ncbi:DUF1810 domain-containing protein [Terrabacter sp. MAHUQ-38]|uniref:DUF1810 domain-containing protein n=1 Tax=unclassified Terrabacter TaxID=2630222 RepID=UPI00165DAE9F|nr:DUF1810 domain-containing protein [Terrabacter sp. MAHUQ-38]MBC9821077.1 DUF1810 domain-containing protein [Terrabacter sp. MAHUQ-38]
MTGDPYDLDRFVRAQDSGATYAAALAELRAGTKRGHWMWFVLPQVAGLGRSETAQRYAVSGLAEARAYLRHPVLGPRLRECADALDALDTTDPVEVLGSIDATKLRSSMTLFERAAADGTEAEPFVRVLDHFFGGRRDDATAGILGS